MSGPEATPASPPEKKERPMCTVVANSTFEGTEVELIAADKRVLCRGFRQLQATVPAGIYVVRATLDQRSRDEIVVVEPGPTTYVAIEAPPVASPIPLDNTRTSHEYHQSLAEDLSGDANKMIGLGQGAELMVIAREWNAVPRPADATPVRPGANLVLCAEDGTPVIDYKADGISSTAGDDAAIGLTAKLHPGTYRLRATDPSEPSLYREFALYVPRDWQLQVFLLTSGEYGEVLDDDLSRAAITMRKMGRAFWRGDYDGHFVEAARRTLESRTGGLAAEGPILELLLHDKFQNPILGLVAAHAMHMRGQLDRTDLPIVAANLERLLGPIPDVIALNLEVDPDARVPSIDFPPMLRASWSLLLDHSVRRSDLIPSESVAATIAGRVVGSGAWLIWQGHQQVHGGLESMISKSIEEPMTRWISSDEDRQLAVRFFGLPSSLVHVASPAIPEEPVSPVLATPVISTPAVIEDPTSIVRVDPPGSLVVKEQTLGIPLTIHIEPPKDNKKEDKAMSDLDKLYARFAPEATAPQPPAPGNVAMDLGGGDEPEALSYEQFLELKRQFANEPEFTIERVRQVYDSKMTEEGLRELIQELELVFADPSATVAHDLAVEAGLGKTQLPASFKFIDMDASIRIDPSNCRFETKRDLVGWALNAGPFWLRDKVFSPKVNFRWAEDHHSLFHYDLPRNGDMTRMALFADAGTGLYHSQYIGKHIADMKPDVAIYLGDVYYSGKSDEFEKRFKKPFKRIIDTIPLYTLNANHEMFSKGRAYFQAIDERRKAPLGLHQQEGSYFCLRVGDFQIIGIDTSYHETNRHKEEKLAKWLQHALVDGYAKGLSTILCSSDEPYTIRETEFTALFNDVLRSLPPNSIDLWVHGNVHHAAFYDRFSEKRAWFLGACIGHGGYPYTRKSEADYFSAVPVRWIETEARFPGWTEVRQDRGNNGFMTIDIDHVHRTVKVRFIDWTNTVRYEIYLSRVGTNRPLMIVGEQKFARAQCKG